MDRTVSARNVWTVIAGRCIVRKNLAGGPHLHLPRIGRRRDQEAVMEDDGSLLPEGVDLCPPAHRAIQVSVILPCFNEESNVAPEVERICRHLDDSGYVYELIVIDDGSTDGTWAEVQEQASLRPAVRPVRFGLNGGPGTARRLGTERARGAIVVWTDADMTYPNERIAEFVRILDEDPSCDQVVGARTAEQGTHRPARVAAKWIIRKLAERLTGAVIPDLNSGFRVFRRRTALPYLHLLPPGFSCVTTITLAFLAHQHVIRYVPVAYAPRAGRSKFRIVRDAYRYLLQVLAVTMYFSPLRVLTPVALFLLLLGFATAVWGIVNGNGVTNALVMTTGGVIVFSLALLGDLFVKSRHSTGAAPGAHFPLATWARSTHGSATGPRVHGPGRVMLAPGPPRTRLPVDGHLSDGGRHANHRSATTREVLRPGAPPDGEELPVVPRPPPV
jgi:glycosyltransferase involved in cell wall biosynthesis